MNETSKSKEADGIPEQGFGHENGLYNCPFCNGSEKDHIVMLGYKYPKYRISCANCHFFVEDDRKDKVLVRWQIRDGLQWWQQDKQSKEWKERADQLEAEKAQAEGRIEKESFNKGYITCVSNLIMGVGNGKEISELVAAIDPFSKQDFIDMGISDYDIEKWESLKLFRKALNK